MIKKEYCYTNWNDIPWTQSREKVSRKNYKSTHGLELSVVKLEKGHVPWLHSHYREQVIFVLKGACHVEVDKIMYEMPEYSILSIPSWAEHQVIGDITDEVQVLSVFSPRLEEAPTERPDGLPLKKTRVYDFNAHSWEIPREKLRRKIYQGADSFTFSLVEMEPNHSPAPHDHFYVQIVICLEGATVYHIDGEPLPLEKGTILTTPPDAVHYSHNLKDRTVRDFEIFWPKRDDRVETV